MIKPIPIEKLEHFMWHEGDEIASSESNDSVQVSTTSILTGDKRYHPMDIVSPYGLAVQNLQEACAEDSNCAQEIFVKADGEKIYRPLTLRELFYARVNEFYREDNDDGSERSIEDHLWLFNKWFSTSVGVAYEGGSNNFKITPVSEDLITVAPDYKKATLSIDYSSLPGEGLDRTKAKYGKLLTKAEVLSHPAWRAAVEEDTDLLKDYVDIVFAQLKERYKRDTGMRFWLASVPSEDQLRPLFVVYLGNNANAIGDDSINSVASFLRVTQSRVGDER